MTTTNRALVRRRHLALLTLGLLAFAGATACKKEARCRTCGMRIEAASAWRAELRTADGGIVSFDSPRCALLAWRGGKTNAEALRVQDYYDRQMRDGNEVRFVVGGDVVGPMGPDLVVVDPPRVSKFMQDHGAEKALRLDEVTPAVLASIGRK